MRVFFDTEFTGLRQDTTMVSIGAIAENGRTFYAELTDYDAGQVDEWVQNNVIAHLQYTNHSTNERGEILTGATTVILGDTSTVAARLSNWLYELSGLYAERIEMWADCLAYDWVLFCQLFGGAFSIPQCVYYIPFDLATLFEASDIDPDISREGFAQMRDGGPKHNALWDARVIKGCMAQLRPVPCSLLR